MKPLFGDKGGIRENIVLVEKNKIISENSEVAQEFNDHFEITVDTLGIVENELLLNNHGMIGSNKHGVENAILTFETHPSILSIKENVMIDCKFSFSLISADDINKEINSLNLRKAGTFMDIPTKQLKQVCDVVCEPLSKIWNKEIIEHKIFPAK